jgi:hypothetical protein
VRGEEVQENVWDSSQRMSKPGKCTHTRSKGGCFHSHTAAPRTEVGAKYSRAAEQNLRKPQGARGGLGGMGAYHVLGMQLLY